MRAVQTTEYIEQSPECPDGLIDDTRRGMGFYGNVGQFSETVPS